MSGFVQGLVWMTRGLGEVKIVSESSVKAVLARIADAASDEGEGLRPLALCYLADDTGLKERQVQRALARLKAADVLDVAVDTGRGRGKAALYKIDLDALSGFIPLEKLPAGLRARVVAACRGEGDGGAPENTSNCRVLDGDKRRQQAAQKTTIETVKDDSTDTHYVSTKTTKRRGRASEAKRSRRPAPDAGVPPPVTLADLGELAGAEGALVRAALNGWQKPERIKPFIGRFRVLMVLVDLAEGDSVWRIATDCSEDEFKSVFTGAMIHLNIDARLYGTHFAGRAVDKNRARYFDADPWHVALKPDVLAALDPTAKPDTPSPQPEKGEAA